MELDHLWVLVLYLVCVLVISLLDHEATLLPELGPWGVSELPYAFYLPELLSPTTHEEGYEHSLHHHMHSFRV